MGYRKRHIGTGLLLCLGMWSTGSVADEVVVEMHLISPTGIGSA